MDLTFSTSELAFRDELRAWLQANPAGRSPEGEDAAYAFRRTWQRRLYEGGWAAVHWPRQYGGRDATLVEAAIFYEELARARAPDPGQRARHPARRPDPDAVGHRGAEGPLPHPDPLR